MALPSIHCSGNQGNNIEAVLDKLIKDKAVAGKTLEDVLELHFSPAVVDEILQLHNDTEDLADL